MILGFMQYFVYLGILIGLAKPLGIFMANIFEGKIPRQLRLITYLEKFIYRFVGIRELDEMSWKVYAVSVLTFNVLGIIFLYFLQRLQGFLPLNPQHLSAVSADSALNTAISFVTNTNWQGYGGEYTLSYLTQMLGLAVQNFLSAATGMAVLVAIIRGFSRKQEETLGSFWVDLVRSTLYILLPLSAIFAIILIWQGVPQTFHSSVTAQTLQVSSQGTTQTIAVGPVATQIAIKQLGTNGGGYFNVNSAHPFENPTPLTNFLQMLAILLIPAALCYSFGVLVKDRRQGWTLLTVMTLVLTVFWAIAFRFESSPNPNMANLGINLTAESNREGKESRFTTGESVLWSTATTAASNGSVNSMHDSLQPVTGLIAMVMMLFGEVIFGGVGSGLYGMLAFVIVAVFVSGLMVGRTPEYLGKKVESFEMKMAAIVLLIVPVLVLIFTALTIMLPFGKSSIFNAGPHGFSEVLYAFASAANNNGSAFGGINANTPFFNILLGIAMFFGRYWIIFPMLAMAGGLARKQKIPESAGTLGTHTPLFIFWLTIVIVLVGILNYLPVLALGPIVEQLMLNQGLVF